MLRESLRDDGPLHLKNVVLGRPSAVDCLPFDPRRDMAPEEWDTLDRWLEKAREEENWDRVLRFASTLTLLGKAARLTAEDRMALKEKMEEGRCKFWWNEFMVYARGLSILGEELPTLSHDEWQNIHLRSSDPKVIACMELLGHGAPPTEQEWTSIDRHVIAKEGMVRIDHAFCFALYGKKPRITPETWKTMQEELDFYRKAGAFAEYPNQLLGMWLLSAGQLVRTPEGLRVSTGKKEVIEPFPATRKFYQSLDPSARPGTQSGPG